MNLEASNEPSVGVYGAIYSQAKLYIGGNVELVIIYAQKLKTSQEGREL